MVSFQPPVTSSLTHRLCCPASCSRFSLAGTLAVFFLLIIAGIPLVSADDTGCNEQAQINGIYVSEQNPRVDVPFEISALMRTCNHCYYHWFISYYNTESGATELISENFIPSFSTSFSRPGTYHIDLQVGTPKPVCNSDDAKISITSTTIEVIDPCPAGKSSVMINQPFETSVTGSSTVPYWTAVPSQPCTGCSFTWSLYKSSEEIFADPIPLTNDDLHIVDGRMSLQHRFTQPGKYKINVRMENPPGCEGTPTGSYYASYTVNHYVTMLPGTSDQPSGPEVISPVALDTPATGTQATTPTPTRTVTQPQVTYTAIPASTQPVATLPPVTAGQTRQPTVQLTGTPAPAHTGSENQASGAAPVVTNAAPAGSEAGVPAAAVPTGTAKKTPGFAFAGALCAGLVVLVFRRK